MQILHITFFFPILLPLITFAIVQRHLSCLPNKLLNDSYLCACEQATCGSISRFFERTEESFGGFQFMAEEARGGAVFLVGVVTHGEVAEGGHHRK